MRKIGQLLIIVIIIVMMLPGITAWAEDDLHIYFVDVGQADAAIITCSDDVLMIDGGNVADSQLIFSVLRNTLGNEHINYMIATHPHEDHVGGLVAALNACSVDVLLTPVMEYDTKAFRSMMKYAEAQNTVIHIPSAGNSFMIGSAQVEILGPTRHYENDNDMSIVCKITYGETTFLFGGDAEWDAEHDLVDSGADLKSLLKGGAVMPIIETHTHLSHFKFENQFRFLDYDRSSDTFSIAQGDRCSVIERMTQQRIVAAIEPGIDLASNQRLIDLAKQHPGRLFPAVGLHPTRTPNEKWKDQDILKELTKLPEVCAIGETGLDFHFQRKDQHRLVQLCWFIFQILLAHRRKLPLILHIRQADRMAIPILRLFKPFLHGGVAHCFYGDVQTAHAFIRLGFHLGIGGTLLQDNEAGENLRETVRQIPLERLLLETDAPYVHPNCDAVPNAKTRSKVRNTSLILPAIAQKIAELKGIEAEAVEEQTTQNAIETFHLRLP